MDMNSWKQHELLRYWLENKILLKTSRTVELDPTASKSQYSILGMQIPDAYKGVWQMNHINLERK